MWLAKLTDFKYEEAFTIVDLDVCWIDTRNPNDRYCLRHPNGRMFMLPKGCDSISNIPELKIKLDMIGNHVDPSSGWRDQDCIGMSYD